MCLPSNHLQLCTCDINQQAELPEQYWRWYRFIEGKDLWTLGEPRMPLWIRFKDYQSVADWLVDQLNNHDPFDIPLTPAKKDMLEICLKNKDDVDGSYYFHYTGKAWKENRDCDFMELMSHYDEVKEGIVKTDG